MTSYLPTRSSYSARQNPASPIIYRQTSIQRHTKVKAHKSPFDGDWSYWSTRLGKDHSKPKRLNVLMKMQRGQCDHCNLRFRSEDVGDACIARSYITATVITTTIIT